jgi:hypothetical protein
MFIFLGWLITRVVSGLQVPWWYGSFAIAGLLVSWGVWGLFSQAWYARRHGKKNTFGRQHVELLSD